MPHCCLLLAHYLGLDLTSTIWECFRPSFLLQTPISGSPPRFCRRVRNAEDAEDAMPHAFSPDERCLGGVAEIHAEYTNMRRRLLRARPKVRLVHASFNNSCRVCSCAFVFQVESYFYDALNGPPAKGKLSQV